MRALSTLLVLTVLLAAPADAQKRKGPSEDAVNKAIARGVEHLRATQTLEGRWAWTGRGHGIRPGATALALYAMLKSGVPATDPAVLRGAAALQGMTIKPTYDAAAAILAMIAHDPDLHHGRIAELTAQLVDEQNRGIWGYGGGNGGDLSNTQYAVIALWAASREGFDVPKGVWETLLAALPGFESSGGGFGYSRGNNPAATGTMTAAGLACLDVCVNRLGGSFDALPKGPWAKRAKERALRVLGKGYRPDQIEGQSHGGAGYYIYGIERVGALCDIDELGGGNWYDVGARYLLKRQLGDGSWKPLYAGDLGTAYALLFLSRATATAKAVETGPSSTRKVKEPPPMDRETARLVTLARDFGRSQLHLTQKAVQASSSHQKHLVAHATDGLRRTWWLSKASDKSPTLTMTFERPVVSDTVVLVGPHGEGASKLGGTSSAIVLINGEIVRRGVFSDDDLARCRITLPAAVRVHSLKIQLVRSPGSRRTGLGLAEVDLLAPLK